MFVRGLEMLPGVLAGSSLRRLLAPSFPAGVILPFLSLLQNQLAVVWRRV